MDPPIALSPLANGKRGGEERVICTKRRRSKRRFFLRVPPLSRVNWTLRCMVSHFRAVGCDFLPLSATRRIPSHPAFFSLSR